MSIQAIESKIADLTIKGKRVDADISGAITGDVPVKRTISGASSIVMTLLDPNLKLLSRPMVKQRTRLTVDGLDFVRTGVKHKSGTTILTFEDAAVARLRQFKGPVKASRDAVTRAQFIGRLARAAEVPFVSPERRIEQPIEKRKPAAKKKAEKDERREYGFDGGATIKVKGVKATASQRRVAEEILDEGVRLNATFRVLSMAIACATQESNMADLTSGDSAHPDSAGPFGQWLTPYPKAGESVTQAARYFYKGIPGHTGIIDYVKEHPDANFSLSIQAVQQSAYPTAYQQWKEEANDTVREYLGGTESTTYSVEVEKPYSFEVGKEETYWEAIQRLAKEVNWRAFVTAGKLYYFTDKRLLASRPRMRVSSDFKNTGAKNFPPGIDDVRFEINSGKAVETATIVGRANVWAAPPGSAVILADDFGPATGRWLVSTIASSLSKPDVTITLKRPAAPLPEPAPDTATRSMTIAGSPAGGKGAAKAVKWAESNVGVTQGSTKYNRWMSAVGGFDPWCSFWIGYLMREVCGLSCSGFGHSDYWSTWSGAKRVSVSNIQPGDIVGYSGTHVALYVGGGECISGNYGDKVARHGLNDPSAAVSYVVRPKYRD